MFRTKKGKTIAISILIIVLLAGALCAYVMLTGRSGRDTSDGQGEVSADFALSGGRDDAPDAAATTPAPTLQDNTAPAGDAKDPKPQPEATPTVPAETPGLTDTPTREPEAASLPDISSIPAQDGDLTPGVEISPSPAEISAAPTGIPSTETPAGIPTAEPPAQEGIASTETPLPTPAQDTPVPTKAVQKPSTPTPEPKPTKDPVKTPTPEPAAPADGANGSVSENGQLQVIGTQLSNAAGDPVVLRGISTHGIAWFPDLSTKPFMQTLKEEWGASVFRIAMYSYEGSDSYVNNPGWNKTKVCSLIDAAIELDMYVIVDWHILADGNPQTYQKQAAEFFAYIASTYPGVPNILYEICNEPNGGTGWSNNIKPYANEIIPVIREHSPEAVIIVGTPTWSQDVDAAAKDPLSCNNVMYALHFYAGTHKEWLRDKANTALAKGLPLFVTEWGTTDASGNGAVDKASSDEWLSYLEEKQISWCNWSLCNKSESSALLLPSAPTTGAMPDSSLTESGKYIKGKLLGYSGTTPVEQKPQNPTDTSGQKATPTPTPGTQGTDSGETDAKNPSAQNPPASGKSGLTLLYYNENREDSTNTISPRFQIKNNTGNDISLDKLTIQYYYTPEKEVAQCFFCDYADVNGSSYRAITSDVTATFVSGEDSCVKITFSSGAGILAAGDTASLQVRITNEDWSNYIQSNDASFSPDAATYTESSLADLISK